MFRVSGFSNLRSTEKLSLFYLTTTAVSLPDPLKLKRSVSPVRRSQETIAVKLRYLYANSNQSNKLIKCSIFKLFLTPILFESVLMNLFFMISKSFS
jgi:hypothetical protein